ncbi:MAG: hypothetical protein ACI4OR_00625 [Alphaproteobacteria bacterium]
MFFTYKRVFWLSAIMTLFVLVPFHINGFSTDVWMRMVRIQEWMNAGFPMQETLMRAQNYPYGVQMHWTRFMDIIGYVCAWPFMSWLGFKKAMEVMAWIVPLITLLIGVRGYFYGVRGYFSPKSAFLSFWLFFYGVGYIWGQSRVGYFDHHVFHFTLLVWVIALILRGMRFNKIGCYVGAGGLAALGTWMTVEFAVIPCFMIFPSLLYWLLYGRSLRMGISFLNAYTLVLLLCLLINPPMGGLFHIDLYNFSFFYILLGLFALVPLLMLEVIPAKYKACLRYRLEWGLLLAGLTGGIFLWLIQPFLGQTFFDAYQYHIWISKVGEMQGMPLFFLYPYGAYPIYLAFFMLCWAFHKRLNNRYTPLILLTAPALFVYGFIFIAHIRTGITVGAFFIFLVALYVNMTFFPREKSREDTFLFLLAYLPFIACVLKGEATMHHIEDETVKYYYNQYKEGQNVAVPEIFQEAFRLRLKQETEKQKPEQEREKPYSCSPNEDIFKELSSLEGAKAIWTDVFSAPEIAWESGMPVFSGPYHTNIQGLDDLFALQMDKPPFNKTKEILFRRGISHLYVRNPECDKYLFYKKGQELPALKTSFQYFLYHQKKGLPKWVKLVYKNEETGIKIYEVQLKGGKK